MQRSLFPVLILASLLVTTARASDGLDVSLFRPVNTSTLHLSATQRAGAAFVEMDRSKFAALATWRDFLCVIPDFPLGQDGLHGLRVEQFDAVASDIKGRFAVPAHVFFRGSVDGIPQSHVCLTLYEDCAWGYINAGDKTYIISAAGRSETGELILGITQDTAIAPDMNCGTKDWNATAPKLVTSAWGDTSTKLSPLSRTVTQLTVALEMDYPVVQRCGGTALAAFKYGLSVIAAASDLYMRDANIALVCSDHLEWTTTDPYSDVTACEVLNEFTGQNMPNASPTMYVLMSGRRTDWCGGVARDIDVLCGPDNKCVLGISHTLNASGWNYPYTSWTWDAMVCAHETGHLVACAHTHNCYFWGGTPIDSCVAAEGGNCYDTPVPSKGTIMSYCHTTPAGAMLKFHPKCITLMEQRVQQQSCKTLLSVPSTSISPTRRLQTCATSASFSITASSGTGPYVFEFNPAAATVTVVQDTCSFTLKPTKTGLTFYIRVTDANGIRIYDSVTFLPSTYRVTVNQNSLSVGKDSVQLTATPTDTTGATCVWYQVPNGAGRTLGKGWQITLPRDTIPIKYAGKATSGVCVAADTVIVSTKPAARGVAGRALVPFRMFPNPARDRITAIIPADGSRLWIEDVLGRRTDVPTSRSTFSTGIEDAEQIDLDISALPAGSYWLVRDASGTNSVSSFQKW